MIKIIALIKKRADLTAEQFRSHYENNHVNYGMRFFGHLFAEYRRNYPVSVTSFTARDEGKSQNSSEEGGCGYDVVTEIVLKDQLAVEELIKILDQPEVSKFLAEDEARFCDRAASKFVVCDVEQSLAYIQWQPSVKVL